MATLFTSPRILFTVHSKIAQSLLEDAPGHAAEAALIAYRAAMDMGRADLMTEARDLMRAAMAIEPETVTLVIGGEP